MGTLDDAIREHLELKKRSGASEDEVRRMESDAFGPARNAPPAAAAPPATEEATTPPATPEPAPAPEEPEAAAPASTPPPTPAPAPEPEPWLEDDEPDEVPLGDALDHRRKPEGPATSEFTAAEAAAAGGETPSDYVAPDDEQGEDLLEETPEFLQETPEHDRLWFEQKPPRDFDFDS